MPAGVPKLPFGDLVHSLLVEYRHENAPVRVVPAMADNVSVSVTETPTGTVEEGSCVFNSEVALDAIKKRARGVPG
jgi:hypothetical protein